MAQPEIVHIVRLNKRTDFFEYDSPQYVDLSGFFGDRNKFIRRNQLSFLIQDPDQCLCGSEFFFFHRINRLIIHHDRIVFYGLFDHFFDIRNAVIAGDHFLFNGNKRAVRLCVFTFHVRNERFQILFVVYSLNVIQIKSGISVRPDGEKAFSF